MLFPIFNIRPYIPSPGQETLSKVSQNTCQIKNFFSNVVDWHLMQIHIAAKNHEKNIPECC